MSTHPTKLIFTRSTHSTSNATTVHQFLSNLLPAPPAYTPHNPVTQMAGHAMFSADDEADQSPIAISIISPITVIGDSNQVSLDPVDIASRISQAVSSALRAASMSSAGIPMIDENGRPRPIEVRVDAGIKIEGNQNTIGEKAFQALREDIMSKQQKGQNEIDQQLEKMEVIEEEEEEGERGRKRHRAA